MKPPLEILTYFRTYDAYGGLQAPIDIVADALVIDAPSFGSALNEINVIFNCPPITKARPTLEDLLDRYIAWHQSLPKVVYRRSRQTAEISIASELLSGNRIDMRARLASWSLPKAVALEVVEALRLLRPKFKRTDDYDIDALLQYCEKQAQQIPETEEEFVHYRLALRAKRSAITAAMSDWEKLAIDFRDYHPDARQLLDDPWFWDCGDDFAPHGNDTGADILEEYRTALRKYPDTDPAVFHSKLLKQWGYGGSADNDPDAQRMLDEAAVAIAFAEMKLTAACHPKARKLAEEVIHRQRQEAEAAVNWGHRAQRLESLTRLQAKLAAAQERH